MKKRLLSLILALMMLFSLLPTSVLADDVQVDIGAEIIEDNEGIVADGSCGEALTWTLDENGTLTIDGTGDMDDYEDAMPPWNEYMEEISSVVITEGVTSIGMSAFYGCTSLESVSFSDGLKTIGDTWF